MTSSATKLALPPSVLLGDAKDLLKRLTRVVSDNPTAPLIVDASALHDFDSSVLAVLLECRRLAQASHREFVLRDAPPRLHQLAGLYGVAGLLGIEAPAVEMAQPA
ncbi:MAG: STAS domain-containing protein [Burkholderiaceae bacterium]|nr:STAS domain-containing protein [Burkholderiaceae bacterium]